MLKLIKCEFWKLKRKRLLYALMSLSLFFPLILAYMAKAGTGADTTEHYLQTRFDYVYTMMLGYGLVFLLPCLIGIIAAILLATGIGFYFEYDASKKFDLLNAGNEETLVKVIRNGRVQEIPRKDVVVGDIIVLETGEEIPADGELLEAISLQINESNLTGEPVVSKTTVEADFDEEATYASNKVMRGTTVVDGHGTMRVLCVGDDTEIGKVARQSTEQSTEPTPLNIQLTKLANLIGKIGFSVAGLAFAIFFIKDVLLHYDFSSFHTFADWLPALKATLQYFMMAVTLIVVAVEVSVSHWRI